MAEEQKKSGDDGKEMLLVQSKVKEYIRAKGLNVSGDLSDAVNEAVYTILDNAVRRAQANGRKTARGDDV